MKIRNSEEVKPGSHLAGAELCVLVGSMHLEMNHLVALSSTFPTCKIRHGIYRKLVTLVVLREIK